MSLSRGSAARLTALAAAMLLLAAASDGVAQMPLGAGAPAWLAYAPVRAAAVFPGGIPDTIVELDHDTVEDSAAREIELGWRGMLRHEPRVVSSREGEFKEGVVVGTQAEIAAWNPRSRQEQPLAPDAYRLYRDGGVLVVEGGDARGVLYGAFALLRLIGEEHSLATLDESSAPWAAVRWTNE